MSHDPYQAFRYSPFRRFLIGMTLVQISAAMQGIAIAWEIYVRTNNALALGLVGLTQADIVRSALPEGMQVTRRSGLAPGGRMTRSLLTPNS